MVTGVSDRDTKTSNGHNDYFSSSLFNFFFLFPQTLNSDTEDHKPLKGSRTPSNGTVRRDESDDSLVDYGEGGDGQFNEDGSFIGQYSGKKEKDTHEGNESSEAPSPVNAMNSFV